MSIIGAWSRSQAADSKDGSDSTCGRAFVEIIDECFAFPKKELALSQTRGACNPGEFEHADLSFKHTSERTLEKKGSLRRDKPTLAVVILVISILQPGRAGRRDELNGVADDAGGVQLRIGHAVPRILEQGQGLRPREGAQDAPIAVPLACGHRTGAQHAASSKRRAHAQCLRARGDDGRYGDGLELLHDRSMCLVYVCWGGVSVMTSDYTSLSHSQRNVHQRTHAAHSVRRISSFVRTQVSWTLRHPHSPHSDSTSCLRNWPR